MPGIKRKPVAFSYIEIKNHILSISDKTDRFMFACSYGNGTRISEVLGLRTADIEIGDEFIYIQTPVLKKRNWKGKMYRAPPISIKGEAWLAEIIIDYVSNREGLLIPYSKRTAQYRFDEFFDCTSHSFRHSRAMHCFRVLGMSMEKVGLYFRLSPRGLTDWIMRYGHLDSTDLEQHLKLRFQDGSD